MYRAFAVIGFSFLFTAIVAIVTGGFVPYMLGGVALAMFIASLLVKQLRKRVVIPMIAASVCVCSLFTAVSLERVEKITCFDYSKTEIVATLIDNQIRHSDFFEYRFSADVDGVGKIKFLMFSEKSLGIEAYDKVKGCFDLSPEFCSRYSDYAESYYLSCYTDVDSVTTIKTADKPFMYKICCMKEYCRDIISKNTEISAGGLTKALLFSDKSDLSDDDHESFTKAGLLHTTATSGMHLALVISMIYFLLNGIGVSRKKRTIIGLAAIILYTLIIGFRYSVLRAGIMLSAGILLKLFGRESDSINALGFSCFVFVLLNPYAAVNIGYLLSLGATLGMILLYKPVSRFTLSRITTKSKRFNKVFSAIITPFLQSLCVQIFIFPLVLLFFGYFSISSPLANLFVIFPIMLDMLFGLLIILFGGIPFVGGVLGVITNWISGLISWTAGVFAQLDMSLIRVDYFFIAVCIGIVLLLCTVTALYLRRNKVRRSYAKRITALLCAILILCSTITNTILTNGEITATALECGDGITLVLTKGDRAVVVGCAGQNVLNSYQRYEISNGISEIDLLLLAQDEPKYINKAQWLTAGRKVNSVAGNADLYLSFTGNMLELPKSEATVWDDVSVICNTDTGGTVTLIKVHKTLIMLAQDGADLTQLPDIYKDVDIVITTSLIPKGYSQVVATKRIICSRHTHKDSEKDVLYTAVSGNVNMSINKNGAYRMR